MEQSDIPTEIHLCHPPHFLGAIYLDEVPQPGSQLEVEGNLYTVLERRHRYQLRTNRYHLHQRVVTVQPLADDAVNIAGQWSIGDITCQYNARSALLRCAIKPNGPCQNCDLYVCKTVYSSP